MTIETDVANNSETEVFNDAREAAKLLEEANAKSEAEQQSSLEQSSETAQEAQSESSEDDGDQEQGKSPVIALFQQRGYDVSGFSDDDEVVNYMEEVAERARDYETRIRELENLLNSRQVQPEPAKQPEPVAEEKSVFRKWEDTRPAYDESWESVCEFDPKSGRYVLSEPYRTTVDPSIAQKLTEFKKWELNTLRSITREFPQQIRQQIGMPDDVQSINELIDRRVQEHLHREAEAIGVASESRRVEGWMRNNLDTLYQVDSYGNIRVNATTGQNMMTPAGEVFSKLVTDGYEMAEAMGIEPPRDKIFGRAIQQFEDIVSRYIAETEAMQQYQQQEEQSVPVAAEQKRETFLQKAIEQAKDSPPKPQREGSIKRAVVQSAAQNPDADLRDMMMQEFRDAGLVS